MLGERRAHSADSWPTEYLSTDAILSLDALNDTAVLRTGEFVMLLLLLFGGGMAGLALARIVMETADVGDRVRR